MLGRKKTLLPLDLSPNCKNTFVNDHNFDCVHKVAALITTEFGPRRKTVTWKTRPSFRAIFTINITTRENRFAVGVEGLKDVGFVASACDETERNLSDTWWVG